MPAGVAALVADGQVGSREESGCSVLAAIADGHVGSRSAPYWSLLRLVTWSSDRLSDMSWMTSSTCIRPAGITSYLLTSPLLVVFVPLKATVHSVVAGTNAYLAACFTVAIYPCFHGRLKQTSRRICIIILLISVHHLP